jgi:SAM-dependent methyltransferase
LGVAALLGSIADLLNCLGVGDLGFRIYQRLQAVGPPGPTSAADGLPVPPPYLRVLTTGRADAEAFLGLGRAAAGEFLSLAQAQGVSPSGEDAVLEFGCGCGRVARHIATSTPARVHGCDVEPRLLAWCRENLPGDYRLNSREPPLPYEDGAFALVYALSVFTHMHEPQARVWLQELARVTRPRGLAILTFMDEHTRGAHRLRSELSRHGFAVKREGSEGSNLLCGCFTPEGLAARAAPGWRLSDHVDSRRSVTGQAVAVFRRI